MKAVLHIFTLMKSNNSHTNIPADASLPWHIHFDEKDDKKGDRIGRLIHVNKPEYECRFYIGKELKEGKGLTIHNVSTGVQLYDLKFPEGVIPKTNFKEINTSMKEGASFLYDILYLPFFRKS